jgi:hypothetical protein
MDLIYISNYNKSYKGEVSSLFSSYQNNSLSILCGAGISFPKPSNLPGADALKENLVDILVKSARYSEMQFNYSRLRSILKARALEVHLDIFVRVFGIEALEYIVNLDIDEWNTNHYCIAKLAHNNPAFKIITLNFDVLIESVLDTLGSDYIVRCPLSSDLERKNASDAGNRVEIIKPHGSFPLPSDRQSMPLNERVKNITTTLKILMDKPDPRTAKVIQKILSNCTHLLVVGYSGEDWDIVPILSDLRTANPSLKITWVKHSDKRNISDIAKRLLDKHEGESVVAYGDACCVLRDLVCLTDKMAADELQCPDYGKQREMNAQVFQGKNPAALLALSCFFEGTEEEYIKPILKYLSKNRIIKKNPNWHQCYLNVAAWDAYTRNKQIDSIRMRKQAFAINKTVLMKTDRELSEDYLNLGYHYLKYSGLRNVRLKTIFRMPIYFFRGYYYLNLVRRLSNSTIHKAQARYYKVSLFHSYALLLLTLGKNKINLFRKFIFKIVCHQYARIDEDYMKREYFYLRLLEARILSGTVISPSEKESVLSRINQIEDYFLFTDDIVHLRNICITRAFLSYAENPDSEDIEIYLKWALAENIDEFPPMINDDRTVKRISDYLKEAANSTEITAAARLRYAIFNRYFFPDKYSFTHVFNTLKSLREV